MDLRQLDMFRAVAETSSFTRAGEKLHVSHSAISRQVKMLEYELGTTLFTRANKRVFLTEPGKALFSHAGVIFRQVAEAAQSVSLLSKRASQSLNLGTGTTMLNFFLPPVLADFRQRFPAVSVRVKTGQWPVMVEDARAGVLDVLIGTLPVPFEARDFQVAPLYREELVVVAGKGHPFTRKKVIEAQELHGARTITFTSLSATRHLLDSAFRTLGISPQIELELENDEAVVRYVSRNMGVAFLPKARAIQEKLHFLRLADSPIFRTVGLVSLRSRATPEPLTCFSKLCIERAKSGLPSEMCGPGPADENLSAMPEVCGAP